MALVLGFSKGSQSSQDPQVIAIKHGEETAYILVTVDNAIRIVIDAPKSFEVDRIRISELRKLDAGPL